MTWEMVALIAIALVVVFLLAAVQDARRRR
jgi:hypothetical protein